MSDNTPIDVQIIERDLVNVDLQDRELINIDFTLIDRVSGGGTTGTTDLVENETPNQLSSKQFQTNFNYQSNSLKIYFNGIRETHITKDSANTFSFLVDIIPSDDITIDYIKL